MSFLEKIGFEKQGNNWVKTQAALALAAPKVVSRIENLINLADSAAGIGNMNGADFHANWARTVINSALDNNLITQNQHSTYLSQINAISAP
jgi:hypothetical protein